jgi:ABC-type lipoprotein release transport system permease subunit
MFKTFINLMKTEQSARKFFFKIFSISVLSCLIGIYFGIKRMKNNGDWDKLIADIDPSMVDHFILSATVSYIGFAMVFSVLSSIYFTVRKSKE